MTFVLAHLPFRAGVSSVVVATGTFVGLDGIRTRWDYVAETADRSCLARAGRGQRAVERSTRRLPERVPGAKRFAIVTEVGEREEGKGVAMAASSRKKSRPVDDHIRMADLTERMRLFWRCGCPPACRLKSRGASVLARRRCGHATSSLRPPTAS